MDDEGEEKKCYVCDKPANDEDKCFGCGKYIHTKCDKNPDVGGKHRAEMHMISED